VGGIPATISFELTTNIRPKMIKNLSKTPRFALLLAAVVAVALNFSASKAAANTIVTINSNGTASGLTGLLTGNQADTLYPDGGAAAPNIVTTAFFFPTLSNTDIWGVHGNGWLIIYAPNGSTVVAVAQFDNATDIPSNSSIGYETLYFYGPGNLPPSADYTYSGEATITENANGSIPLYAPGANQAGVGYDASGTTPESAASGGSQVDFQFHIPDGADTICLLGLALVGLAGIRRRFFAC
jgi:hypothetical protein